MNFDYRVYRVGATNEIDIRGINCPLGFIAIREKLSEMAINQVLIVLTDDISLVGVTVPNLCKPEKFDVVTSAEGNHWKIIIKKLISNF